VERAWWTALCIMVVVSLSVLSELLRDAGTSNLHLRAATLRAAGGSARAGARFMCCMRTAEAAVVWLVLFALQRSTSPRRRLQPIGLTTTAAGVPSRDCAVVVTGGSSCASSSNGSSGSGGGSGALCDTLPISSSMSRWPDPSYPPDCASPDELKEQMRRASGPSPLLCSLTGWVWVTLGCFSVLGAICSLLVAIGGHSAPGLLGELMSHDGPLGRRSVLGRSLPILAWFTFELGSTGALYAAALSLLSVLPLLNDCGEPTLSLKLRAMGVHALAVLIAGLELYLNDLPILWQHMPLPVLMGCAFGFNLLGLHAHYGRFIYLFADPPHTSAPAVLLACAATPAAFAAAFATLASLSSSEQVRAAHDL